MEAPSSLSQETQESTQETPRVEGEVPLAVAQSERPDSALPDSELEEVVVVARRERHDQSRHK